MKLKYYLRGLGIGMLVAALVLILSGNTGGGMSDEAVKRRAAELGMVEKDKTVLGDIGGEAADGEMNETETSMELPENEPSVELTEQDGKAVQEEDAEGRTPEGDTQGQTGEPKPETESPQQAEEADAEEQALAQEIEQRAEEVVDRAEEAAENSPSVRTVTLEVRTGDSSISVARRAQEAGLVQSAADFDVFLCQNGFDKRISIGSYEITVGASEKEIAEIITKSR